MTTAADDSAGEEAFEAYLAGRPVPDDGAGLAAFAGAVRMTATQPGRPNAALAELLATGLLTDQPSPSTRTARPDGASPSRRGARIRRRRRIAMFFPVLLAKFLASGAVAQAATGAGVALVAFTGAGAAGALPDPVQDTFATVVATVTPLEAPTSEDATVSDDTTTDGISDDTTDPEAPAVGTPEVEDPAPTTEADGLTFEDWKDGPAQDQSFGAWVSEGARHGHADGRIISEWAHKRNEQRHAGTSAPAAPTEEVGDESAGSPEFEAEPEVAVEPGDRRGGGNSDGNGNGHGGTGGGGNGGYGGGHGGGRG